MLEAQLCLEFQGLMRGGTQGRKTRTLNLSLCQPQGFQGLLVLLENEGPGQPWGQPQVKKPGVKLRKLWRHNSSAERWSSSSCVPHRGSLSEPSFPDAHPFQISMEDSFSKYLTKVLLYHNPSYFL